MVSNFEFNFPVKVLFGPGSLKKLHEQQLPGKKALVAISGGGSMKRHGQLDALYAELDAAGVEHVLFEGLKPNPTNDAVDEGAKMAKDNGCDFIVAIGGGSTMDASKIIAAVATNPGCCWDYSIAATGGKKQWECAPLPLICITTSAGTGSEVDVWSVITNEETDEKSAMMASFPVLSVVDSDLMMSVPPTFTAYQGMDAFFHAAETIINKNCHVFSDMMAMKTVELVAKYLPRAVADGSDVEARSNLALANTLAGYYMMCTSEHTLEHAMGSFHSNLVHGAGLIMISHAYYDFFAEQKSCEDQMIRMAKAMGVENATSGKDFVAALDKLLTDVNCADLKMSEVGITEEELPKIVAKYHEVIGGNIFANPTEDGTISDEDLLAMLKQSYK